MKRTTCIILAVMLCFLLLACGQTSNNSLPQNSTSKTESLPQKGSSSSEDVGGTLKIYIDSYYPELSRFAVDLFKKEYPEVDVQITDYSALKQDEYAEKLKTELMAGQGPDVVVELLPLLAYKGLDKMVQSGAFADIEPLIKADSAFNIMEYNEAVLDTGLYAGKRYVVPLNYKIKCFLTTESNLEKAGLKKDDFKDLFALSDAMKNAVQTTDIPLMPPRSSLCVGIQGFLSKPFAEMQNGKIIYSEELYRKAAESYLPLYEGFKYEQSGSYYPEQPHASITNGSCIMVDNSYMSETSSVFSNAAIIAGTGEVPVLIPLYNELGEVYAEGFSYAAIPAQSKNQLNAWRFIKIYLSQAVQANESFSQLLDIPVRNDALSAKFNAKKSALESSSFIKTDAEYATAPLGEAFYTDFLNSISSINTSAFKTIDNNYMSSLVTQQFVAFYKEEKTIDDAINELKSHFEIFLSE